MYFEGHWRERSRLLRFALLVLMGSLLALAAARVGVTHVVRGASVDGGFYRQTNLVSDLAGKGVTVDPHLKNPWGLAHTPTGPWWVADNNGNVATVYRGDGTPFPVGAPLVINIPAPGNPNGGGSPTGNVFNPTSAIHPDNFLIGTAPKTASAIFLFSTEDGTIAGWNPNVDATHALIAVDRSKVGDGAVYKGLAFGSTGFGNFIYATNFRAGVVEMFDARFRLVRTFTDQWLAAQCLRTGQCFAPFGIQNIGGKLYVTYALQDKAKHDDVKGPGNGFVDVFDTLGRFLYRFASRGTLNSPWGLALAPDNFGRFSHALLVGNFGDGHINAFDPRTGFFEGQLSDQSGAPLVIDGLWGLAFGNGGLAGRLDELFFSAGINDENDGLFGKIVSAPGFWNAH